MADLIRYLRGDKARLIKAKGLPAGYTLVEFVSGSRKGRQLLVKSNLLKKTLSNPAKKKKAAKPKINQAAVKQYMDFHGKDSAKITTVSIDMPGKNDALVYLGDVSEVNYLSNKHDGVRRHYTHEVKKYGKLFAVVNKNKRVQTLIIANVNTRIDKRGLIS